MSDPLDFSVEMHTLTTAIETWIGQCDQELHEALRWQFFSGSKYFRPMTIFSCRRAMRPGAAITASSVGKLGTQNGAQSTAELQSALTPCVQL